MEFFSLQPFVPSGPDMERSKALFQQLGFTVTWDAGDYAGFARDNCRFILQHFNNKEFAENFMINVQISNADEWYADLESKGLAQSFGIKISKPVNQPYGREVNVIDLAGVCWHFVQAG